MSNRILMAVLLPMALLPCSVAAQCQAGPLIGGNIYSIQNDTSKEQYVFVSPDDRAKLESWQRVTVRSGELQTVNYYEGQYAIVVNRSAGKSQAKRYDMKCQCRYAFVKDERTGFIKLSEIGCN